MHRCRCHPLPAILAAYRCLATRRHAHSPKEYEMQIKIENHGPLITASDYWASEAAAAGKMILSPNAGVIRCLLPPALHPVLGELRAAEYAICSIGPWQGRPGVEILWEDHSQNPHAWHLTDESCLMIPGDPGDQQWTIACWVERRGKPHRALERRCHWRRVDRLPCMKSLWQT